MEPLAITVIGHDRPGIIADVTGALAGLGGNLEDSTMTILRGHFAMTLIVTVEAGVTDVESALAPLTDDGSLLVSVREVPVEPDTEPVGNPYVLTVHGADRPGIVSRMTRLVAEVGGNVTDLTTRLGGGLYVVAAEVELPATVDAEALAQGLTATARDLGVEATLRPAAADVL